MANDAGREPNRRITRTERLRSDLIAYLGPRLATGYTWGVTTYADSHSKQFRDYPEFEQAIRELNLPLEGEAETGGRLTAAAVISALSDERVESLSAMAEKAGPLAELAFFGLEQVGRRMMAEQQVLKLLKAHIADMQARAQMEADSLRAAPSSNGYGHTEDPPVSVGG